MLRLVEDVRTYFYINRKRPCSFESVRLLARCSPLPRIICRCLVEAVDYIFWQMFAYSATSSADGGAEMISPMHTK